MPTQRKITKAIRIFANPMVGVFTVALLLRWCWVYWVQPLPVSDYDCYERMARHMAQDFFSPGEECDFVKGFSLFASLFYRIGLERNIFLFFQAGLGALTCAAVAWLLMRTAGRKAAWVGGGLCAFAPGHIFFSSVMGSETLYGFLMIFGLLLVYLSIEGIVSVPLNRKAWIWSSIGGLCLGLSNSVRPLGLFLCTVVVPYLVFATWRSSHRLKWAVVSGFLLAVIVGISLCGFYELKSRGVFRLARRAQVPNLVWQGTLPQTQGGYFEGLELPEANAQPTQDAADRVYLQTAIRNVLAQPFAFTKLVILKWKATYQFPSLSLYWNFNPETGVSLTPRQEYWLKLYLNRFQRVLQVLLLLAFGSGIVAWWRGCGDRKAHLGWRSLFLVLLCVNFRNDHRA